MNRTEKIIFIILFLFCLTFLLGQEIIEAIVAIVNDDVITLSEYKEQNDLLYMALQSQLEGEDFRKQYELMQKNLLDKMITDLLLLQEAKRENMDVSEQMKITIENIKKENSFETEEQLNRALIQQGTNFEDWKNEMEENFLRQNVIFMKVSRDIVIDNAEIVNYYKEHSKEFTELPEYKLKAIYISEEGKTSEEIENLKEEISTKLAAGEDLASLSSQYSEGPEREAHGDLGSFKKGELEKSLEMEVEKLDVGEKTSWLNSRNGCYLLQLEDKKESRLKAFDEVKKEIEEKLFTERRNKKLEGYLKDLKERSYIKILMPDPLKF